MKLFDTTFSLIERAMDLRMRRHSVLSGNIANSETPNYRARELDFSGELDRMMNKGDSNELATTNPRHMDLTGGEKAHVVYDDSGAVGSDGNNVDLDLSVGKISENAHRFTTTADFLDMKLRIIRFAARGGRGGI